MQKPKYSIIITTRNEEESIGKVICSVPENIRKQSEIIVADSSDDFTPVIAEKLGAKVLRENRKGKGRAMRAAVKQSIGSILVFLDGDGTDPPSYIPKLLKKLEKAEMVLGARSMKDFKEDDKLMCDVFKIYHIFARYFFGYVGLNINGDPLAGFRAIRRADWDKLNVEDNDFIIETEMNLKAAKQGFRISEVPIPHLRRGGGLLHSKLVANPRMWIRIMAYAMKHANNEKARKR